MTVSVVRKATGGVAWTVGSGLASRGIGMLGTLIITRYLAPEVMGEITTATVLAFTANAVTQLGLPQYVILRSGGARDRIFHATVLSIAMVSLALGLIALSAPMLGRWFDTPDLAKFLPGMALAVLIRRIGSIPDKLLLKQMRFRTVAAASAIGEFLFAGVAVTLVATTSLGGHSIVIANIVQAATTAGILIAACGTREWLTPVRLSWKRFREIFAFGLPLGVEAFFYESARYADKLVFTKLFGPGRTGEYSLAYSLADIPASQVGEQVSNVTLPTLLRFDGEKRRDVLVRAIGLLSLLTFPMAAGLGVVAPTLVEVILPPRWHGVAPFLMVLAVVSMLRPVNGLISQYLISIEKVRVLMRLEILRAFLLFGSLSALGQIGSVAAAFSIGIASSAHMAMLLHAVHGDGRFLRDLFRVLRAPLFACMAMCTVVLLVRSQLEPILLHDLRLLATEILAGMATYVLWLYAVENSVLRDVISLARGLLRREAP